MNYPERLTRGAPVLPPRPVMGVVDAEVADGPLHALTSKMF
jgi:hypothetical protein